ncbi:MAG TPA: zf-HC2 domain-containing protein [Acidimicrobiales bacterium]|jgi:hypothetical protein|nr:zf-HC2 domain-containing protein [Acidimicrobiales bacterium]
MTDAAGHLTDELSALLDGELADHEAVAVRAHLSRCAFCTSELAAVDRTRSLVRELPPVDPPGVLRLPAPRTVRRGPLAAVAAAAAAAAAAVLVQWAPADHPVSPKVATLVEVHATSGVNQEPTQLAPAAVPVDFRP